MELLTQIFELCIVPLLGLVTTYIIALVRSKMAESKALAKDQQTAKYLTIIETTITNAVLATNQTYVDALKNKNAFDAEAQKEAFRMTYEAVMSSLSADAEACLNEVTKDATIYITEAIEAAVARSK